MQRDKTIPNSHYINCQLFCDRGRKGDWSIPAHESLRSAKLGLHPSFGNFALTGQFLLNSN